jgi:hypothetical protein
MRSTSLRRHSASQARQCRPPVDGTVQLVTSGPDFDAVQSKVPGKYGVKVSISKFFNTLGHLGRGPFPYADVGVIVTFLGGNLARRSTRDRLIAATRRLRDAATQARPRCVPSRQHRNPLTTR